MSLKNLHGGGGFEAHGSETNYPTFKFQVKAYILIVTNSISCFIYFFFFSFIFISWRLITIL